MATEVNAKLLALVKDSGLLNPSATLDDIMKLNGQFASQPGIAAGGGTGGGGPVTGLKSFLVHGHFVLVYNDEA